MNEKCSCCGESEEKLALDGVRLLKPEDKGCEVFEFGLSEYSILCEECLDVLEDEFSDMSHIIPNESEEDFFDHENLDD